jgi:uncharacterized protein
MDRDAYILAVLAAAGEGATFSPVQIQKLFFLIDREAFDLVSSPHFNFQPDDYGPFDREVYIALNRLAARNLAQIYPAGPYRLYSLSPEGYRRGLTLLDDFSETASTYMRQAGAWVRQLSFQKLVAAIYRHYPDMQVNSIFSQ